MPEPPRPYQTKNEFMEECMGSEEMKREYPDKDQRVAVCISYWERSKENE